MKEPRKADVFARIVAVLSLMIGSSSLILAIRNSALEGIDALRASCPYEFTGHVGFTWPNSYPVPDSIKDGYSPLVLATCDLTNAGRRDLSVVRFALGAVGSMAPQFLAEPDSSVIGLPLTVRVGETKRVAVLLAMNNTDWNELYLLSPAGKAILVGFDWPKDTVSGLISFPGAKQSETQIFFRFTTGLGATATDTVGFVTIGN